MSKVNRINSFLFCILWGW